MNNTIPSGYVSEQAKRTFTISVGVLGAIFFFAQFIVPFILMVASMPLMIFSGGFEFKDSKPHRGAWWNNKIWFIETTLSTRPAAPSESTLKMISIVGEHAPLAIAGIPFDNSWLLSDAERLWIVSSSGVGYFADGTIHVFDDSEAIGDISRPFLLNGEPAVIEESPAGYTVMVFSKGGWQVRQSITLEHRNEGVCCAQDIQILSDQDKLHFFIKSGDTIFYRTGLPIDLQINRKSWQPITEAGYNWHVALLGGQPVVFTARSSQQFNAIRGFQITDGRWRSFFSYDQSIPGSMGVFWSEASDTFFMMIESFPGSLKLLEFDGSEVIGEIRYGDGFPFPKKMMTMMFIPQSLALILPLILAIIVSGMMVKHRICNYETGHRQAAYASLTRRALAQIIDAAIVLGPSALFGLYFFVSFWDFEEFFISGPFNILSLFGMLFLGFIWIIFCYFIFSYLEGAYGRTPGKWVTGIRVLGTDLKPCGMGRALLRNLLKVADGFFNFMVGIMLVALTENWQRVGDLAARTVVVRAGPVNEQLQKGKIP